MPKLFIAPFYSDEQIHELEENQFSFPFSSKYMRYDSVKRQYVPTEALLLKHGLNINNLPGSNVQDELNYISDQIYYYIGKQSGSDISTLKWIVAKGIRRGISPFRFRMLFEDILFKQAKFYMENDDPTKTTGIDLEQKQWLNKGVLINEDRNIAPQVKTALMDLGLVWAGSYDKMFFSATTRKDW